MGPVPCRAASVGAVSASDRATVEVGRLVEATRDCRFCQGRGAFLKDNALTECQRCAPVRLALLEQWALDRAKAARKRRGSL